jgi:hypothetical protein
MDNSEILLKQYDKLFSLYEFHHKRWDDHWKVYLIILSILTAILSGLFGKECENAITHFGKIKTLVAIMGIIISISGCIALSRIRNDSLLTLYHLRKFESIFKEMGVTYIPIITNGYEFFNKGELKDPSFEDLKFRFFWIGKIKVFYLAVLSFSLFAFFFLFTLIFI